MESIARGLNPRTSHRILIHCKTPTPMVLLQSAAFVWYCVT